MRTTLLVIVAALMLLGSSSRAVLAVTDGVVDTDHPYVGLVVFYDADGEPTHRCSGTLISPTVFLTAGHCTFGATTAAVYFGQEITDAGYPFTGGVTGIPYTMPGFDDFATFPDTSDVGVVVLDEAVDLGYASIAPLGTLDGLATQRGKQDTSFTVVGYGLQSVKPTLMADRVRLTAEVRLINLRSSLTDGFNLHHTNAKGTGGGTCFGDSGGPVFLSGTSTIVGVTSFGLSKNCTGNGFAYRTDTQAAQNFIYSFL